MHLLLGLCFSVVVGVASGVRRMNQLNGYGLTTGVCRTASCFNIIIALRRTALRDTVIRPSVCLSVCPSPRLQARWWLPAA